MIQIITYSAARYNDYPTDKYMLSNFKELRAPDDFEMIEDTGQ